MTVTPGDNARTMIAVLRLIADGDVLAAARVVTRHPDPYGLAAMACSNLAEAVGHLAEAWGSDVDQVLGHMGLRAAEVDE